MEITNLRRTFTYGGMTLPDPDASMTPMEVRDLYAATGSPELATAEIRENFDAATATLEISFHRAVGTKGLVDLRPATGAVTDEDVEQALRVFAKATVAKVDDKLSLALDNLTRRSEDGTALALPSDNIPWIL